MANETKTESKSSWYVEARAAAYGMLEKMRGGRKDLEISDIVQKSLLKMLRVSSDKRRIKYFLMMAQRFFLQELRGKTRYQKRVVVAFDAEGRPLVESTPSKDNANRGEILLRELRDAVRGTWLETYFECLVVQELSVAEVATKLGVSVSTVERAKRALRTILDRLEAEQLR